MTNEEKVSFLEKENGELVQALKRALGAGEILYQENLELKAEQSAFEKRNSELLAEVMKQRDAATEELERLRVSLEEIGRLLKW